MLKSMKIAVDTYLGNSECEWVDIRPTVVCTRGRSTDHAEAVNEGLLLGMPHNSLDEYNMWIRSIVVVTGRGLDHIIHR